jgi:Ca2+/Na+ antiporter
VPGRLVGVYVVDPEEASLSVLLFVACLAVTLFAARQFAGRLDRLGNRFGFSEALIGLLTAVAADGPEISSALFALASGANSVSVGVLVGSCTFNLAAMVGLSGLLAGAVRAATGTLALEGSTGAALTAIGAAMLLRWIAPVVAAALAAVVIVPYLRAVIRTAGSSGARHSDPPNPSDPMHHLLILIVFDIALIVAGSAGMVHAALTLGHDWQIPRPLLGVLVLGPLTSLPNAMTGVRLGLAGRGEALVGETLNSNAINIAVGVVAPALFVAVGAPSATEKLELAWLAGMTAATLLLLARRGGLDRRGAVALIVLYGGFVAIALAGA